MMSLRATRMKFLKNTNILNTILQFRWIKILWALKSIQSLQFIAIRSKSKWLQIADSLPQCTVLCSLTTPREGRCQDSWWLRPVVISRQLAIDMNRQSAIGMCRFILIIQEPSPEIRASIMHPYSLQTSSKCFHQRTSHCKSSPFFIFFRPSLRQDVRRQSNDSESIKNQNMRRAIQLQEIQNQEAKN